MKLALLLVTLFAAPAPKPKGPAFENYTLANGLEVILHEDHRLPQVTVNLWYHVGAADERAGRSGFAHLFEHMMFQGSRHVGDDQHFAILESIGARGINATTNFDRTNYFQVVPRNQLETALWLESDRMGFLLDTLTQKKLDNQRDVVRNERRQRTENRPYGKADERVIQLLFPEPHPYHGAVIGSHEDLQAASLDDVKQFFRAYYAPSNATLVLAGDFDPAEARRLVEQYFGSLPAAPDPPPVDAKVQGAPEREHREELTDAVALARVTLAWIGPTVFSEGSAEIDLVADALGGGNSSILYKRLVYEQKIAQAVSCYAWQFSLGGTLACEVTAKPGVEPKRLEQEVDAAIAEIAKAGLGKPVLARAKTRYKARRARELESAARRADRLNYYHHYLGDPGFYDKDLARYDAVTTKTTQVAAARWLDPARRVVVTVLPEKR